LGLYSCSLELLCLFDLELVLTGDRSSFLDESSFDVDCFFVSVVCGALFERDAATFAAVVLHFSSRARRFSSFILSLQSLIVFSNSS